MTLYLHDLTGCSPAPLANYLKALGILRLVSEQADPNARGWWQDEHFCLLTKLSKEELESFFLEKYEPTPIFNPWGGRSGYYAGSSEKTARVALVEIQGTSTARLKPFRDAISLIRSVIENHGGDKPDEEEGKTSLISEIRQRLRGTGAEWLGTVMANLGDSFRGPAIMGTGGNEGSGSYTASFLGAVVECLVRKSWNKAISASLWSDVDAPGNAWDGRFQYPNPKTPTKLKTETVNQPFRQFMPEGEANPWDLLLAFEGTVAVQSGVTRRSSTDQNRFLTSPFYFAALGIGAASSSDMDEFVLNKGRKNPGRGEQWFPLWESPTTYSEISALLREGRCTVGKRNVKTPVDAVRAIQGIGTSRGIKSFLRYGYLQRNNLATHFAVPLGRVNVKERSDARLIDDLAAWIDRIHRLARKKNAPARLSRAYRQLAEAVLAALTHDLSPDRWQSILVAAVAVESLQATGTAIEAGPMPSLRPEWIRATDDGSSEFRLALALGSAAKDYSREGRPIDSVRGHWLPLEPNGRRFKTSDKRLMNDPRVVVSGRDPLADCAAIVERRLIEAAMKGQRYLPLVAARGCGARFGDLAEFLSGSLDVGKIFDLARAFMAIRWDRLSPAHRPANTSSNDQPEEAWLALRLACLPWPLEDGRNIPAEPAVIRRLMAGDVASATAIALRRLRAAGIRSPLQAATADPRIAQLWAAALVFPIDHRTATRAAAILDPSLKGPVHA